MKKVKNWRGILCVCILMILSTTFVYANAEENIDFYYLGCKHATSALQENGNIVNASASITTQSSNSYDSVKIYARLQQVSTGETVKTWNSTMKKSGTSFNWSGTYTTYSSTTYRLKVSCSGYKDGALVETITLNDVTLKTT